MIYLDRKEKYLSRSLGVYVQANTGNPTGWRPQYTPLGEMTALPDWKTAVAVRDAGLRNRSRMNAAIEKAKSRHMAKVDAAARGDLGMLHALAGLNPADQLVQGAQYVFHFKYGGLGIAPEMTAISQTIAADTNFGNPVAAAESGGVQVAFTYNGQGSNVGDAGREMQNVINTFSLMGIGNSLNFSGAEQAGQAVLPGQPNNPPGNNNNFNWKDFLAGLGIGGGTAAVIAGVSLFLLLRD